MKVKSVVPLTSIVVGVVWIIYGVVNHGFWDPIKGPVTGFFAILVSIPLVVISIVCFIQSFKETDSQEPLESWSIMLAAVATIVLTYIIGMIVSLIAFVFFWLKFYEKMSWKTTIINLVVAFAIIYGVFGMWLQVPFPNGIIVDTILNQ